MKKDITMKGATPTKLNIETKLVTKRKYFEKIFLIFFLIVAFNNTSGQSVKLLTSGTKTSLRGLSVISEKVIWASGSNGMVALSTDSGNSFKWLTVKGFEKTDFRDIEAFDDKTAVIMGIDSPGVILKTIDAGVSWKVVFENHTKGIFLDAMDFYGKNGVVVGDPINNLFFMATTNNVGDSWQTVKPQKSIVAENGEAAFASSGTNIRLLKNSTSLFVSGGMASHFFLNDKKINIPILQGKESTGANSIAFKNNKIFITVGGDFNTKDSTYKNCFFTKDGGVTWNLPKAAPTGYRSCIEYVQNNTWVTCGINGVDITNDDGVNFMQIANIGFNVCRKAKQGKVVFFAGSGGKIAKIGF